MARRKTPTLLKRQRALEATMAKFRPRMFAWKDSVTCVHMLRFHLKRMGHDVPVIPKLSGTAAAKRELKKRGWDSVEAMLDELLEPIPVAQMLPGDVSVMPGGGELGGIVISLGTSVIGYSQGTRRMVVFTDPAKVLERAWRV